MNVYPKGFAAHSILDKPPTSLNFLKHLCLGELRLEKEDDILCAVWLVRESPKLKAISIDIETIYLDCSYSALEILKQQHTLNVTLNHLHEVKIQNAFVGETLMEFIKFLLAKSPNLRKVLLSPVCGLSDNEQLLMARTLLGFRRASSMLEIDLSVED